MALSYQYVYDVGIGTNSTKDVIRRDPGVDGREWGYMSIENPNNSCVIEYKAWLDAGNTPTAADIPANT